MVYVLNDSIIIDNNCNVGIGTFPSSALDIRSSDTQLVLPSGGTSQQVNKNGMFRFNTDTSLYELFVDNWMSIVLDSPEITSVSTNVLKNIDDSIIVTGASLLTSSQWRFIGTSKKQYIPKSITYISDTAVSLVRPDVFQVSDAPYQIQCRQMGKVVYYSSITAGSLPFFTTSAGLLTSLSAVTTFSSAATIIASDDSGISSLSLSSGSLPPGLSGSTLISGSNATFVVSGTTGSPANETTYPFTITVTDTGGNSLSQVFSLKVLKQALEFYPNASQSAPLTYAGGTYATNGYGNIRVNGQYWQLTTGGSVPDGGYAYLYWDSFSNSGKFKATFDVFLTEKKTGSGFYADAFGILAYNTKTGMATNTNNQGYKLSFSFYTYSGSGSYQRTYLDRNNTAITNQSFQSSLPTESWANVEITFDNGIWNVKINSATFFSYTDTAQPSLYTNPTFGIFGATGYDRCTIRIRNIIVLPN